MRYLSLDLIFGNQWSENRLICSFPAGVVYLAATLRPGRGSLHGLLPALGGVVPTYSIIHPRVSTMSWRTFPYNTCYTPFHLLFYAKQCCYSMSNSTSIPKPYPDHPISMSPSPRLYQSHATTTHISFFPLMFIMFREKHWRNMRRDYDLPHGEEKRVDDDFGLKLNTLLVSHSFQYYVRPIQCWNRTFGRSSVRFMTHGGK